MTRKQVLARTLAAAAVSGGLLTAGYGYAHATIHPITPASCSIDGGTMASGDAGIVHGQTFVCTDGTLIHVTSYGN